MKRTILFLVAFFISYAFILGAEKVHAYNPPIGIPDPGWGIDEVVPARPSSWSSEIVGYYFINYETGTDTGRTYGTPNTPRKTIPALIPAGSYVEVAGIYSYAPTGSTFIQGTGTSDSPVWVVGIEGSEPIFSSNTYLYGTYLYVDNIKSTSSLNIRGNNYTANHIMVRNSDINPEERTAMAMLGTTTTYIHDIVLYNNTIHDTYIGWNDGSGVDTDYHGIGTSNYVEDIWILSNTFYNIAGNAIQIGGATDGLNNVNHIYFGKNTISKTRQSAIGIKKSSDIIISENNISDTREVYNGTGSNFCAGVSYQYAPQRLWILYNTIHGADHGIKSGSSTSPVGDYVYMIGNLIYNISNPASGDGTTGWDEGSAIRALGAEHISVIGNSIYDSDIGIETPQNNQYLNIENNIISEILYDHIRIEFLFTAANGSMKNNIFYQTGVENLKIGANEYTVQTYPYGSDNLASNPLFIDPAINNFRLQTSSPAKDNGILSDVYATFSNLYGVSINYDITGVSRPQNSIWDIGAYEYDTGSPLDTTAPSSPTNLSVL